MYYANLFHFNKRMWELGSKYWITHKRTIKENVYQVWSYKRGKLYSVIQGKIECLEDYETEQDDMNIVWIMEEVKKHCSGLYTEKNTEDTLYYEMKKWLNIDKQIVGLQLIGTSFFFQQHQL